MAASEKPAYVYMVRCAGGQLYTGWTNDPSARLKAHQSGRGDKSAALRREIALKKLPKARKEALCAGWAAANIQLNMHKT